MSSNGDNVLIDLDNSNNETPKQTHTPLNSLPRSAFLVPSSANDVAENNPFDLVDKQVNLMNDPFEFVDKSAVNSHQSNRNVVETGTLISLDVQQQRPAPDSEELSTIFHDFFGSPRGARQKDNEVIDKNALAKTDSPSPSLIDLPNTSMSTPVSRAPGKPRSGAMNLLKYTLSSNFVDSNASGTPEGMSPEDSPKIGSPSEKFSTLLQQKKILLQSDDSFDDLASTKPNWVDSETDIDCDIDTDIAKMNIPMLNKSIESNASIATEGGAESSEQKTDINKLMEKFASIKLRKSISPKQQEAEQNEEDPRDVTPEGKTDIPALETAHVANDKQERRDPNSLIDNLKSMIEQCEDKCKILEAKTLLESLSSILTKEKNAEEQEESNGLLPHPHPIKRQGTFNIDRIEETAEGGNADEEEHAEASLHSLPDKELSQPVEEPQATSAAVESSYSQVLKDLQSVFQNSVQPIITSTANAVGAYSAAQPTVIVLVGAPTEEVQKALEPALRSARSTSLSTKDRPAAAISAALKKADKIHHMPQLPQVPRAQVTPTKRPSLVRRNSFNAITRPLQNSSKAQNEESKPAVAVAKAVPRRRSLQGPAQATEKEPSISRRRSGEFQPPSLTRRKSFSNACAPAKESPLKIRPSAGTIKKSIAPPATKNLKIRVKESLGSRSTAPLRATVPMGRVAPLVMINESVSPVTNQKQKSLITSTPRSLVPPTPSKYSRLSRGKRSVAPFQADRSISPSIRFFRPGVAECYAHQTYLELLVSHSDGGQVNKHRPPANAVRLPRARREPGAVHKQTDHRGRRQRLEQIGYF